MAQLYSGKYIILILILFTTLLNFYKLGDNAFNPDEAVYAAQAAIWTGNEEYEKNFIPYSRSANSFQLYQVLTSFIFKAFGVSEFTARLIPAILGVLLIPLIYLLAREIFSEEVAVVSAFFTSVNAYLIHFSRQAHLDIPMVFFFILATYAFVRWERTEKDKWFFLFLASAILAVATKITAFILFPIVVIYCVHKGKVGFVRSLLKLPSILVFFVSLVIVLFYLFNVVGFDEWLRTFEHGFSRPTSKFTTLSYIESLLYFVGYPATLLAIFGLLIGLKEEKRGDIITITWFSICLSFIVCYPLKAYAYILPAIPFLCILCG